MSLGRVLRSLKALASLLTSLPLGPSSLEDAARAFHLVPLVGLLEGVLVASVLELSARLNLNPLLSGALFALAHVAVTGGLHLDGFSDYSDVVGARARGDRAASILKDPRRGSFAVTAVALNLLLTTAMAAQLRELSEARGAGGGVALPLVTLCYVLSAESLYLTLLYSETEPYDGMAKPFSIEAKRRGLKSNAAALAGTVLPLQAWLSLRVGLLGALIAVASALCLMLASAMLVARDSASRLGYSNGDVAGFSYELTRLLTLGASVAVAGLCWTL